MQRARAKLSSEKMRWDHLAEPGCPLPSPPGGRHVTAKLDERSGVWPKGSYAEGRIFFAFVDFPFLAL